MNEQLYQQFLNPSNQYRGKLFSMWNSNVDKEELRRQIRMCRQRGFGGFQMFVGVGLAIPYLTDEWFDVIEACCDEAEKNDIEFWLSDEDRWPSGAAGGIVTKDPRFRQRRLQLDIISPEEFRWADDILCAFTAKIDGKNAAEVKRILPDQKAAGGSDDKSVLVFRVVEVAKSSQFNGQTYLDTLSYDAVKQYITVTHEQYKKRFGSLFGNVIKGIFTDEPYHESTCEPLGFWHFKKSDNRNAVQIPWTSALPEIFQKRYGYDILEKLPEVIFDIDGQEINPVRHHYHDCKAFLFVDAYARQIGQWCGKNGIMYTGHILHETPISAQASTVGSAMRFYEHMQAPGIDCLTDRHTVTKYRAEYDTPKQCASVLNQCGKDWMLSELYGCTGWDFSFEGNKAVGDWQTALGVNLRSVMSWYTMADKAKRDYPASICYQSPWWTKYNDVEDYFARVNVLMTKGSPVRRLLVIHPLESMWQVIKRNWRDSGEYKVLDTQMMDLSEWLLQSQIDFDYGDEEMLSRLASVRKKNGKTEFVVGKAAYDTVLFPSMLTVRGTTLAAVEKFVEAGGKVVFTGHVPEYVDAKPCAAALELSKQAVKIKFDRSEIIQAVDSTRKISVTGSNSGSLPSILYMLREDKQHNRYLFLCNTDRKNQYQDVEINIRYTCSSPEEWDAAAGKIYLADFKQDGENTIIKTSFEPSGSGLFYLPSRASEKLSTRPILTTLRKEKLHESWEYSLTEPNVVVLDTPRYRIDNNSWEGPIEILRIDHKVRDILNVPRRDAVAIQPWAREEKPQSESCHVELLFEFDIAEIPDSPIDLAIEQPERFVINLNGSPVNTDGHTDWWTDKVIKRIPLEMSELKKGTNTLGLAIDYTEADGLEMIFLLGDFGVELVDNKPTITELPARLRVGGWVKQSLPFYSGAVRYETFISKELSENSRVFLELPEFAGTCVCISMNDKPIKTLCWPPYEVDITDALNNGPNKLTVEVFSHRRNSFGPLHIVGEGPKPGWTGRGEFVTEGEYWQDEYHLVPCGLLKTPILSYRTNVNH
ncbi:MAG: glycosyl hydrolase [Planctomycetota bacterium]